MTPDLINPVLRLDVDESKFRAPVPVFYDTCPSCGYDSLCQRFDPASEGELVRVHYHCSICQHEFDTEHPQRGEE